MSVPDHNPAPPNSPSAKQAQQPPLVRTRTTERMVRATLAQVLSENHGGSWLVRSKRDDLPAPGEVARNLAGRDHDGALLDRFALPAEQDHGADRAA